MSTVQDEIARLRTLQESYNDLASSITPTNDFNIEVQKGKEEIVKSIKLKGGTSSATKPLVDIAKDITNIDNITKEVTEVSAYDLLLPCVESLMSIMHRHYNELYPTMQGGVVLAHSTIFVNDRPYALITPDEVILEPSGKYVVPPAHYGANYGYYILAYKDRAIAAVANKITHLSYGASNADISFATSLFSGVRISIFECEDCNITFSKGCFDSTNMTHVILHNCDITNTDSDAYFASTCLTSITIEKENIYRSGQWRGTTNLYGGPIILNYPITKFIQTTQFALASYGGGVLFVNAPELETIEGSRVTDGHTGTVLCLPKLKKCDNDLIASASIKQAIIPEMNKVTMTTNATGLIDIVSGKNWASSINISNWRPDYLSDANKVATLNANLRNHLIANLPDNTDSTAYTLTFYQAMRNVLEEETEQAFAAKNWNIAPAKSV